MAEIGLFEAIHTARALRRLKPDPVPDEIIEKIIDAAIRAPSSSNTQQWLFVAVKDPEQRAKLGKLYFRASQLLAQFYGYGVVPDTVDEKAQAKMMAAATYLFEHMGEVPVIIVAALKSAPTFNVPKEVLTPDVSRALQMFDRVVGASIYPAVQNMILACRGFGLGTVLTTIHTLYDEEVKAVLGLDPQVKTYALLPVGYPREGYGHGPVRRRPISEVAAWDRWGHPMRNPAPNR